jgi:hypothetical protein
MPNWCSNNAEFNNEDVAEVARLEAHLKMLDENKEARDENGLLAFFVPRPPEESETGTIGMLQIGEPNGKHPSIRGKK